MNLTTLILAAFAVVIFVLYSARRRSRLTREED